MNLQDMHDPDYLMEEMTRLPDIRFLTLILLTTGHSFGASSFHVFRMCTGIKKLMLTFKSRKECEVKLLLTFFIYCHITPFYLMHCISWHT